MSILTMSGHNVFTLLMVNSVNNNIVILMTLLSLFLDWFLVTLLINILVTLWSRRVSLVSSLSIRDWSTGHKTNTDKSNTQFIHFLKIADILPTDSGNERELKQTVNILPLSVEFILLDSDTS